MNRNESRREITRCKKRLKNLGQKPVWAWGKINVKWRS